MDQLNYHHLRYFREVAREGHLGRAADRLNVSQSALSMQIKTLEARLGHALFDRVGRGLVVSEAGRIALEHADRIFGAGEELLATLRQSSTARPPLRVGALSTLSRNFQMQFLRPIVAEGRYEIALRSGNTRSLLAELDALALDIVLTTELPHGAAADGIAAKLIAEQPAVLHGTPERLRHGSLAALFECEPLILPTDSVIRAGVEALAAGLEIVPTVAASVDDMAMVRLLTREGAGLAVAPSVVFADEIAAGSIATAPYDLGIKEPFYALSRPRAFPHPALAGLLAG